MSSSDDRRKRVRATWTPPPGPLPRGDGEPPGENETLDALAGEWRIYQRRDGHRYSTDDLLCAWFACHRAEERALQVKRACDLGAGIGSVAMMVAWKLPEVQLVAVEAQDVSAKLFARSIRYNGCSIELRRGDLRDPAVFGSTETFDLVTGSPPYFDEKRGTVSDRPQRGPCRFEVRGGVEGYAATAARILAPRGLFIIVHVWSERDRVRAAAESAGLVENARLPVLFRAGRAPQLGLHEFAHSGAHSPAGELPPLAIRDDAGQRDPAYSAARQWMGFPP